MVISKVVLGLLNGNFSDFSFFNSCLTSTIRHSPIRTKVVHLIVKTGFTLIYRHFTFVNIGLLFRETEMVVCGGKYEKYGKWKRHSSTSFRLGLTVTDDFRLASPAEKKRSD